ETGGEREDVATRRGDVAGPQDSSENERQEVVGRVGDVQESRQERRDDGLEKDGQVTAQDRPVRRDQQVVSGPSAHRGDQRAQTLVNEGDEGRWLEVSRDPE